MGIVVGLVALVIVTQVAVYLFLSSQDFDDVSW